MGRAKEIVLKVIPAAIATPFVKRHHYSGKVVNNSNLHFGVFLDGRLHGVMSYGPSLVKAHIIGLVAGTGWNEFLELNRMAFDSYLPRNSDITSSIAAICVLICAITRAFLCVGSLVSFPRGCPSEGAGEPCNARSRLSKSPGYPCIR